MELRSRGDARATESAHLRVSQKPSLLTHMLILSTEHKQPQPPQIARSLVVLTPAKISPIETTNTG